MILASAGFVMASALTPAAIAALAYADSDLSSPASSLAACRPLLGSSRLDPLIMFFSSAFCITARSRTPPRSRKYIQILLRPTGSCHRDDRSNRTPRPHRDSFHQEHR